MTDLPAFHQARVALVGDRSASVRSHARIPGLLHALTDREGLVLDPYWIASEDADDALAGFDAIWLVPGSPYRSEAGAITAARIAREHGIPFLGTCAGFQHAVLEIARDVCGIRHASHAENRPGADDPLIVALACSLDGHEGVVEIEPGSLAHRLLGAERTVERYRCSYGLGGAHLDELRAAGARFSGADTDGEARIMELPAHPFFLATLFQPELAGDGVAAHPFVGAWAAAAVEHAAGSLAGTA